jgi:hypothetical protein
VQTIPDKGWNTLLRLYGPLEPWLNKDLAAGGDRTSALRFYPAYFSTPLHGALKYSG